MRQKYIFNGVFKFYANFMEKLCVYRGLTQTFLLAKKVCDKIERRKDTKQWLLHTS